MKFDFLANKAINWIGSRESLVLHTIFFVGIFVLQFFGFGTAEILLILTTVVSLEAIYLAIFIQYSVNQHTKTLREVAEDIEEVAEDIEGVEEDVEDISEDVENLEQAGKTDNVNYQQLEEHVKQLLDEVRRLKEKA